MCESFIFLLNTQLFDIFYRVPLVYSSHLMHPGQQQKDKCIAHSKS